MSCRQDYNTRSEYDKHMLESHHSPVWEQNSSTRSGFDLDLQKRFNTTNKRGGKISWNDDFGNIVVEKFAPLTGFRTSYDMDMDKMFNTISR
jgi:hypothetical protein